MAEGYNRLIHKLEAFIKKHYRQQLVKGALLLLGLGSLLFLVAAILELYGQFTSSVRTGLFFSFLLISAFLLGRYVMIPLLGLVKVRRNLGYAEAAKMIGKHIDTAGDKIQSALELHGLNHQQSQLLEASIDQKSRELDAHSFDKLITYKEASRFAYLLIIPVGLWLYFALSGKNEALLESSKRVVMYDREFEKIAPFEIEILNEKLEAESGSDLELKLQFTGSEIPEEAYVITPNGTSRLKRLEDGSFGFTFTNLSEDVNFGISALGYDKGGYKVSVIPVPEIRQLSMQIVPPTYTGSKAFTTNTKPVLQVPEGSNINWSAEYNNTEVLLKIGDSLIKFNEGVLSKRAYEGFSYQIEARNAFLAKNVTGKLKVEIIKDQFPKVGASITKDSMYNEVMYYNIEASDDYGVSEWALIWKPDNFGQVVILKRYNGGQLTLRQSGVLNVDSLGKISGEGSLFFRVWDNDGVNGRKFSDSNPFRFKKLTKEEKEEAFQSGMGQSGEKLDERQEELDKSQELVSEISKSQNRESNSWQKKQEVRDVMKDIRKNISDQRKEIKKQEHELMKDSVINNNELLKEKAEDIAERDLSKQDKELEELMKEIDKMMNELDLKKLQQKLKELNSKMDSRNTMRQSREALLNDLMFKRDMMKNALDMEELAKKLDELSKKNEGREELEEQASAEKALEEIEKKNEDLKKENQKFGSMDGQKEMEKMAEEMKEGMKEVEKELNKKNDQKANEGQQKGSQQAEQMSEQMQSMMQQMESGALEENIETLMQILENLEILSFGIEDNMEGIKRILRGDPNLKPRLLEQQRLMEGNRVIRDSLIALSKRAPQIKDFILEESERVREGLQKATEELQEVKTAESAGQDQFAMLGANNLALMLDNSLRQMQQSLAKQQGSAANCNKPGGGSPKPSNASKMQGELGQKMDRMMKGQNEGEGKGKGEKPGTEEGEGGQRGMNAQQIAEIMSEQEQLRKAIEGMEKEGGSKPGGNGIGEEMKRIEESLANMELEKARRQMARVESRLLESEKADRKQDQKEERKSTSSNELQQLYNKELEEYLKSKGQITESLKYKPVDFSEYYKGRSQNFLNSVVND